MRTTTIGYNTETQVRHSIQDASAQVEARWNYAFWIQNELTVVGDLTCDPDGATARQEWITELGHWYDERINLAGWDSAIGPLAAQIEARFSQTCCQLARTLHTTGVIERSAGRTVPVIVQQTDTTRRPQKRSGTRERHPHLDRHVAHRSQALHLDQNRRRDPRTPPYLFTQKS
jgi:hypothetical protein